MRIKLSHRLFFRFPEAARSLTYLVRLTPRSHDGQRVMRWRIDVEPDCRLKASEDHYGNLTHTLTIPGPVHELRVIVAGELATFDAAGVVRGSAERLPADIFLRDTPATLPHGAVRDFASGATSAGQDPISRLHALMGALHGAIELNPAAEALGSAADVLAARKGNAQDLAHVFLACARHLGWPARCVTGYYVPNDDKQTRHVWAEVLVDNLGWVAFDPSHDICPQDMHIRTAIGLDATDAAGLRGTRTDGLEEAVEAVWRFERDRPLAAPRPVSRDARGPSSQSQSALHETRDLTAPTGLG